MRQNSSIFEKESQYFVPYRYKRQTWLSIWGNDEQDASTPKFVLTSHKSIAFFKDKSALSSVLQNPSHFIVCNNIAVENIIKYVISKRKSKKDYEHEIDIDALMSYWNSNNILLSDTEIKGTYDFLNNLSDYEEQLGLHKPYSKILYSFYDNIVFNYNAITVKQLANVRQDVLMRIKFFTDHIEFIG